MAKSPRMSGPTLKVLRAYLLAPSGVAAGSELSGATGLASGTLYPILSRLEAAGWLAGSWEDVDPRVARRPRKRFYRLTGAGREGALSALAELALPDQDTMPGAGSGAGAASSDSADRKRSRSRATPSS